MTDRATEIARVLTERDGIDPLGDKKTVFCALMERFPGVTADEIIRGWTIAADLSAVEARMPRTITQVQASFRDPPLAWRCGEPDRLWLASHDRAYRVRHALDNEVWALGKDRPADLTALAVIRAADGATMVFAARDPEPFLAADDETLSEHFDREIEAGIGTAARGPG